MSHIQRCTLPPALPALVALLAALSLALAACGGSEPTPAPAASQPGAQAQATAPTPVPEPQDRTLTVYSGRSETLVAPLLEAFGEQTGVNIRVKFAGSASTVATLLEEGDNSPADVVFLQDPGSLGTLSANGVLDRIPQETLNKVDARFRDPRGEWVGTSGRARTVIYNTETIDPEADLPDSILGFADPEWKGRVGWAPQNGSFQAFVTALRVQLGEDGARDWLEAMKANDTQEYPNNTTTVLGVANGEVDVGFVNHYYLERLLKEHGEDFEARNHYIGDGDPGALVLVAGAGILKTSENKETAREFIDFLLGEQSQRYFASEIREYPVAAGVDPEGDLPPLASLDPPNIDLGNLSDLEGTLRLMREVGVLQ